MNYFDISKYLSDEQFLAADAIYGPTEVFACAGSGKTRVLTYRIVNMVKNYNIDPSNILALTFTNKAANEMKKRVENYLGYLATNITLSTIHSFCCRLLRENIHSKPDDCQYTKNFQIKDDDESKTIFFKIFEDDRDFLEYYFYTKEKIRRQDISEEKLILLKDEDIKNYFTDKKDLTIEELEKQKELRKELRKDLGNIFVTVNNFRQMSYKLKEEDYLKLDLTNFILDYNFILKIIEKYENFLEKYNLMDFIAIIKNAIRFLEKNQYFRMEAVNRYRYILVDEYQDVDPLQELLLFYLSGKSDNLLDINVFVVGDDDQSIYGWRGVEYGNLQRFEKSYNAKKFHLSTNYRSTKNIVDKAAKLIKNNIYREDKNLLSKRELHVEPKLLNFENLNEEKQGVLNLINSFIRNGSTLNDIAILSRTATRVNVLLAYLSIQNVPFRVKGINDPKRRKEVKLLRKYLKFLINNEDYFSLYDILALTKGIGETTIEKLRHLNSKKRHIDMFLDDSYKKYLSNKQQDLIYDKVEFIKESITMFEKNPIKFFEYILQHTNNDKIENSFLYPLFEEYVVKDKKDYKFSLDVYEYISNMLNEIYNNALISKDIVDEINQYELNSQNEDDGGEKISVLTIHASKGLEFKNVIILGSEDNLFERKPYTIQALNQEEEIEQNNEEERRVFYVAITRAEDELVITYSKYNFFNSNLFTKKSKFLFEIFDELKKEKYNNNNNRYNDDFYGPLPKRAENRTLIESLKSRCQNIKETYFSPGDKVLHPKFKEGVIKKVITKNAKPESYLIDFEERKDVEINVRFKMLKKV